MPSDCCSGCTHSLLHPKLRYDIKLIYNWNDDAFNYHFYVMSSNCISSRYRFIRLAHWWFRGIRFWNMQCVCAYYISVHAAFSFFCLALYLVSNDCFIFYERAWYPIRGKNYIGKNIRVHSQFFPTNFLIAENVLSKELRRLPSKCHGMILSDMNSG